MRGPSRRHREQLAVVIAGRVGNRCIFHGFLGHDRSARETGNFKFQYDHDLAALLWNGSLVLAVFSFSQQAHRSQILLTYRLLGAEIVGLASLSTSVIPSAASELSDRLKPQLKPFTITLGNKK